MSFYFTLKSHLARLSLVLLQISILKEASLSIFGVALKHFWTNMSQTYTINITYSSTNSKNKSTTNALGQGQGKLAHFNYFLVIGQDEEVTLC